MLNTLGIYTSNVKAHIPRSAGNTAQMPKPRLPVGDSRRLLTASDMAVIRNIDRLYRQHGTIAGNQSELARDATIDQTFISKLLKGKTSISVSYLHKIAVALGVEPWQLLVPEEWSLGNPPALRPISDAEKRLYAKIEEAAVLAVQIAKETP